MKSTPTIYNEQAAQGATDPSKRNVAAEIEHDANGAITIRIVPPPSSAVGSPLVLLDEVFAEREAARKVRDSGELRCAKIGRRWYAKRSDVEQMFDRLAALAASKTKPKPVKVRGDDAATTLAELAQAERRRGSR